MGVQAARILVVDDEPDICANLSDILTDLGYEVDSAYDGPSALAKIRERPYDVALLDLKMPGMDGLEVYRRIKELRADTVAIVVTAYAASDTATAITKAGAWKILSKPVDLGSLLQLIDQALEEPLVLVVDDDHDLCDSLWDVLREQGFRVGLVSNVPDAGRLLGQKQFHVVLIDMRLPDGNGHQVLNIVKQSNPQARTIIITGYRSELEEAVRNAVQAGADAVCYKPFDVKKLLDTVQRLSGAADAPSSSS